MIEVTSSDGQYAEGVLALVSTVLVFSLGIYICRELCDIAYTSVQDAKKVYSMEKCSELLPDGVRKSTPGDTTALAIGNATKRESFHSVEYLYDRTQVRTKDRYPVSLSIRNATPGISPKKGAWPI